MRNVVPTPYHPGMIPDSKPKPMRETNAPFILFNPQPSFTAAQSSLLHPSPPLNGAHPRSQPHNAFQDQTLSSTSPLPNTARMNSPLPSATAYLAVVHSLTVGPPS
ncbi:hypothetical protein RND81_10G026100 [Saponaria officinalis]|uniref:Uncharacterized protein n=1 Tax=Saponaria officinalis TaxID=3572 RepID=A0AAW1HXV2_SAPOF